MNEGDTFCHKSLHQTEFTIPMYNNEWGISETNVVSAVTLMGTQFAAALMGSFNCNKSPVTVSSLTTYIWPY
jgi:hypothetical protein